MKIKLALLATLISLSNTALADREGFYVKAQIESGFLQNAKEIISGSDAKFFEKKVYKSKFRPSPSFSISIGNYSGNLFRFDLEGSYFAPKSYDTNSITKDKGVVRLGTFYRKADIYSLLLNSYIDFDITENIQIFVGGGLGISQIKEKIKFKVAKLVSTKSTTPKINSTYSLTLGTAIKLTDSTNLDITYSWKDYGNTHPKIDEDGDQPTSNRYRAQHLGLGIRFDL